MRITPIHNLGRPVILGACLSLSLLGQNAARAAYRRVVVPAGSVIPVRLNQSLSSKSTRSGDRFTAAVVSGPDDAGLPAGSIVRGVVREAVRSQSGRPGVLDLDFRTLVVPGGASLPIAASLASLDSNNTQGSDPGRMVGRSGSSKNRLKFIGLGAGAGLVIGALTKGNKLTDALIGAGAGYLYDQMNKKKSSDVTLKAGTAFGISFDRQIAFNTGRPASSQSISYGGATGGANSDPLGSDPSGSDLSGSGGIVRTAELPARGGDGTAGIGMQIDGQDVPFGAAQPYMAGSRIMVPLDAVSRAAGFKYSYDARRRIIQAQGGTLRVGLGSRNAVLNGARRILPAAATMRGRQLYVPVQFIALATGGAVSWDAVNRTIGLSTGQGP